MVGIGLKSVSNRTSPVQTRFSGRNRPPERVLDQVEANRAALERDRLVQKLPKIKAILEKPLITVGQTQYTGIQLLKLLSELQDNYYRRGNAAALRLSDLSKALYGHPEAQQQSALKVFDALEACEMIGRYNLPGHLLLYGISKKGQTLLSTMEKHNLPLSSEGLEAGLQSLVGKEPAALAGKSGPANKQARLLALTALVDAHTSGWDLLKQVVRQAKQQSWMAWLVKPGVPMPGEAAHEALKELAELGLVRQKGADRWVPTAEAKALVKQPDPIQALGIQESDLAEVLTAQRKQIEAERQDRLQRLTQLETTCQQDQQTLETLRQKQQADEAKVIELYQASQQAKDQPEQERLAHEAAEKASHVRLQEQEIAHKAKLLDQQKTILTASKVRERLWGQQAHARLEQILAAQHQLEQARLNRQTRDVVKDIVGLDTQTSGAALNQLMVSLLQKVQYQAAVAEVTGEISEAEATQLKAIQALYGMDLARTVSELQAKQASPTEKQPLDALLAQEKRDQEQPPQASAQDQPAS
jgi:hypothetical protein